MVGGGENPFLMFVLIPSECSVDGSYLCVIQCTKGRYYYVLLCLDWGRLHSHQSRFLADGVSMARSQFECVFGSLLVWL